MANVPNTLDKDIDDYSMKQNRLGLARVNYSFSVQQSYRLCENDITICFARQNNEQGHLLVSKKNQLASFHFWTTIVKIRHASCLGDGRN